MSNEILVVKFRKVQNGNIKAFGDVQLGQTVIRDFRVIHQPGQRPWISPPQVAWKDSNGQLKYKVIITFPKELKELVDSIILAHYCRLGTGAIGNEEHLF